MIVAILGCSGTTTSAVGVAADHPASLWQLLRDQPGERHVVLLTPSWLQAIGREQAHVVVSGDRDASVCVVDVPHPFLAVRLIADRLVGAGPQVDPGAAVWLARRLANGVRSALWHPSVRSLSMPNPTMGQHLASFFAKSGYVTTLGEQGSVVTATSERLPLSGRDPLTLSAEPPEPLRQLLGGTPVEVAPPFEAPTRPYAVKGTIELVRLPAATTPPTVDATCRTCEARMWDATCPFCGVGAVAPRPVVGAVTERSTVGGRL